MDNAFTVIDISLDPASKQIVITTNFAIKQSSVNKETVKVSKIIRDEDGTEINRIGIGYNFTVNKNTIVIDFINAPDVDDEFFVLVSEIVDRLGRTLFSAYDRYVVVEHGISSKTRIVEPADQSALKTKDVNFVIAISDEDNENQYKFEEVPSDVAIFNEKSINLNQQELKLEIATDMSFFNAEYITISSDGVATTSNNIKYSVVNSEVQMGQVSFRLLVNKDGQYFVRSRIEENKTMYGEWSEPITFIVKSESLLDKNETFMDSMLFTDILFEEPKIPLEVISRSEDSYTDEEFYIEFNKNVKIVIDDDSEYSEDGLVYIGKCHLIRRDL